MGTPKVLPLRFLGAAAARWDRVAKTFSLRNLFSTARSALFTAPGDGRFPAHLISSTLRQKPYRRPPTKRLSVALLHARRTLLMF
jgi:hypothetical protein